MLDCGVAGLEQTRAACAAAGIATVGAGASLAEARRPACFEVKGVRVVVLAYATPSEQQARADRAGVAPLEDGLLREDLTRWRSRADVLVVSVHWGSMYVDYPPPRVVETAELLAGLGADLILGGHPHVTQGWRRRGRALTLFSLGDLVLDPAAGDFEARVASEARRESGVFTALMAEEPGLELAPLTLDPDGVPQPAGERAEQQRARLERLSAGLDHAAERWAAECAPVLLRYELQSLGTYLRQGRIGRIAKLLAALRPRHLPLLWQALRRARRAT
jgi:poly-gamma-glutamate synthesis protein (capsule biosynthesis protein)